jgi:pSer/pThr/pTyr-binding forkhead associated (FHA) protein
VEVEADVVIGREDADLTIPDEEISRRHAVVRPVERGVVVEDLGSLNGTFVNGEQISEPLTLTLGSMLRLGNSEIQVELDLGAVTKLREVVPAGEPTVAREVPPAEPVAAAVSEPVPDKPPPGGPRGPAPPPRYGGPSESERSRPPKPALIVGVVLAVAILVAVVVLVLL